MKLHSFDKEPRVEGHSGHGSQRTVDAQSVLFLQEDHVYSRQSLAHEKIAEDSHGGP